MEKFERDGVQFSVFEAGGETYLCTGEPTGELKFEFSGEIADYCTVVGATSVVSGAKNLDELYQEWLEVTEFERTLGIKF